MAAEAAALLGPGAPDALGLEAIETGLRRQVLALAARTLGRALAADRSDHAGPTMACPCGASARHAGRRERTLTTVLGDITLSRAHCACDACGAGSCPRDRALGLDATSLSPAVTRMVALVGASVSFAEGSELIERLAGVAVEPKTVERAAEARGRAIADDERSVVEEGAPSAPTMHLGTDGTGVPMSPAELVGRPGKGPDGSARTREAKLVTVWTAEGRDEHGAPVRDIGPVSRSVAIESAATLDTEASLSGFGRRVEREAARTGFDRAERRVVLGDGATWIRDLAGELLPGAAEVVDLSRAKEHLPDAGKAILGPTGDLARAWARERHAELDEGRIDELLAALAAHAGTSEEARRCVGYVTANRERMRYPLFRSMGLRVSSGVVEAGCGVVVGARLKRSGMRWTLAGADAIMALRACHLSGRFDAFWERRSRRARGAAA